MTTRTDERWHERVNPYFEANPFAYTEDGEQACLESATADKMVLEQAEARVNELRGLLGASRRQVEEIDAKLLTAPVADIADLVIKRLGLAAVDEALTKPLEYANALQAKAKDTYERSWFAYCKYCENRANAIRQGRNR